MTGPYHHTSISTSNRRWRDQGIELQAGQSGEKSSNEKAGRHDVCSWIDNSGYSKISARTMGDYVLSSYQLLFTVAPASTPTSADLQAFSRAWYYGGADRNIRRLLDSPRAS